jgi:hypothetical protein
MVINCGIIKTIPGTIMLDRKQKKKKVLPGNFILAKAKAAIELKNNCPATMEAVIKMELPKYLPKGAFFHATKKFSNVKCEGIIFTGSESTSFGGFSAVNTIHTSGKTAQITPIQQKRYVMDLLITVLLCKDDAIFIPFS